ncbi:MAG: transporter [Cyclobacteriaceae bacterium]|jgi:hypothetical protein|nr:transporter [Cyclobacteriaceae bacterium]
MKKYLLLLSIIVFPVGYSSAQTLNDGLMMQKDNFCTGFIYMHDQWTEYWEGTRKRDNGNIGKLTTQSLTWVGNYGITNKLNVIAMLPYVRTNASKGTLAGMENIQDLSVGVKYNFFVKEWEGKSRFKTFGIINFSTPISNYSPDFLPLSIGMASTNLSYRLTAFYKLEKGWFANASAGYTWRSNVELDRPAYYNDEDETLYLTNEVQMPNVFDLFISAGYLKNGLQVELNYIQQNTLGGGDIRRQDMPFVSNKMNFNKGGILVMYYLPPLPELAVRLAGTYTFSGRNVGQSTTYLAGILYTIKFSGNP